MLPPLPIFAVPFGKSLPDSARTRTLPFIKTAAGLSLFLFPSVAANAQLIHSYNFSNGVTDSVGTANGTLLNGATVSGGVLSLDGVNDFVQFGEKIVPTSGNYSVTLFAKQNVSQAGSVVEFISQGFSGGPGFYIGFNTDGTIRVTDSLVATGVPAPSTGVFHHYAPYGRWGSVKFLFGRDTAGVTGKPNHNHIRRTNTRFGTQFDPFNEFFNGSLDDIRIYTNTLTSGEVATLSAAGPSVSAAAPEPGTLALLVPGLAISAGIIRRSRRK